MYTRLFFILFFLLLIQLPTSASDLIFKSYKLDQGLSGSTITSIYKSKNNLVWIGSDRGIDMFTGDEFISLSEFISDSIHQTEYAISCINELNDNEIWAGTWGNGLFSVDTKTGEYKHYQLQDSISEQSISNNFINCLHNQDKQLWIGSNYCLSQTNGDGNFMHYNFKEVLTKGFPDIRAIVSKYDHLLMIITNFGEIIELNTQTGNYAKVGEVNENIDRVTSAIKDKQKRLWIGTENHGVILLDDNYNTILLPSELRNELQNAHVSDVASNADGDVFVSLDGGGLYIVDGNNFSFTNIRYSAFETNSILNDQIECLLFDDNGILWVGNFKAGFSKTSFSSDGIRHYNRTVDKGGILPSKNVNCFAEDSNNNVWVGTETGLAITNSSLEAIDASRIEKKAIAQLKGLPVTSICCSTDGKVVYVGTYKNGLFVIDTNENKIHNYTDANSELGSNFVKYIKYMNDSLVYLATINSGVYKFNNSKFEKIKVFSENNYELKDFFHVTATDSINLWVSSAGKGCIKINSNTGSGTIYKGLESSNCFSTTITSDSSVYVSTNVGLFLYSKELESFELLSDEKRNLNYYGVIEVNPNDLWISTSDGLLRYNAQTDELHNIISINLQNTEYNPGSFLKLSDGRLLFGGTNGVNIIEPEKLLLANNEPSVFIRKFSVYNKQLKPRLSFNDVIISEHANFISQYVIPFDVAFFSIHVNSLNYIDYQHNPLMYTIDNGNTTSDFMETKGEISFVNLKPGDYALSIYPINSITGKPILSAKRSIQIHKQLAWWQSVWAYIVLGVIIILIILIFHLLRVKEYKRTKRVLQEKVTEKTAILLSQKEKVQLQKEELQDILKKNSKLEMFKENIINMIVHDLKNPINGIIGLSSLNEAEYLEAINSASRQMLYLVENILDVRQYETHSLKLFYQQCNIRQLANEAISEVRFLLKDSQLEIHNLMTSTQVSVDKDIIRRVFINLLTNAIKYSKPDGKITLTSSIQEGDSGKTLLLSVEDEGSGIPEEYIHSIFDIYQQISIRKSGRANSSGLGLSFCKIAVSEHKGTIGVESELGKGTTFNIELPLEDDEL